MGPETVYKRQPFISVKLFEHNRIGWENEEALCSNDSYMLLVVGAYANCIGDVTIYDIHAERGSIV